MRWKDREGAEWVFVCNVGTMARVKKETGVDLTRAILEGSTVIEDVIGDVALFFDVISILLRDQIQARGLSLDTFGDRLNDEDIVTDCSRALVEGIISFFPPARREPLLRAFSKLWTLSKERHELEARRAAELIDGPNFDKLAKEAVESGKFNTGRNPSAGVSGLQEK